MRRFATAATVVVLMAVLAASASAAVQGTLAMYRVNYLDDQDFEVLLGNNLLVEQGDLLLAIIDIQDNYLFPSEPDTDLNGTPGSSFPHEAYGADTHSFTGISLIKVDSVTGAGTVGASYTFTAPTPTEWTNETGLTGVDEGVMVIAYDDPVPAAGQGHIMSSPTLAAAITSATEGTRLWELGLDGTEGLFWSAVTTDVFDNTNWPNLEANPDATDISQIDTLNYSAALNVIDYNAGVELQPHNTLADPNLNAVFRNAFVPADLHLTGTAPQADFPGAFQVSTQTDFYIYPVPEPATLVTWLGLLGLGVIASWRRRRA